MLVSVSLASQKALSKLHFIVARTWFGYAIKQAMSFASWERIKIILWSWSYGKKTFRIPEKDLERDQNARYHERATLLAMVHVAFTFDLDKKLTLNLVLQPIIETQEEYLDKNFIWKKTR